MTTSSPFQAESIYRSVFEALPLVVLVVDDDVKIQHLNPRASKDLALDLEAVRNRRTGEVLHCVHALHSHEGCGRGEFCSDCLIRNSVILAQQGCSTYRRAAGMVMVHDEKSHDIHILVSANPMEWEGTKYVVLTIEDASDLIQLRNLIPICMYCRKIRDEAGAWHELSSYIRSKVDVDFSHGVCPGCVEQMYHDLHKTKE